MFEVKQLNYKKEEENFAIKRIELNFSEPDKDYFNETILKELENFSVIRRLNNEKVVEYYDLWFERGETNSANNSLNEIFKLHVYIQMELCDKALNNLLEEMKNDIKLVDNDCLILTGYCISSILFIQILEGVNYLHSQNPSIIHRDLNPYNILLKINKKNNSVIKIADMGLVCLHKYKNQSHTQDRGHIRFVAPEVRKSRKYDTRADIYSLAIVLEQLFLIDINRYLSYFLN